MGFRVVTPSPEAVLAALFEARAVGFKRGKAIRFKQKILSPGAYINNRALPSHRKEWAVVIRELQRVADILHTKHEYSVIASIATGAIVHGGVLAWETGFPHVIVKAEEKTHGLSGLIDGDTRVLEGARVLLIEDMSSTFKSSLAAMRAFAEKGVGVSCSLLINTWGFPEFHENVGDHDVVALCSGSMIVDFAESNHIIDAEYATLLRKWIADPYDESWVSDEWIIPPRK